MLLVMDLRFMNGNKRRSQLVLYIRSQKGYDLVWMIIDCLTKLAHFLLVKMTYGFARLEKIYVNKIVKLHSVSNSIVSDIGPLFTSRF